MTPQDNTLGGEATFTGKASAQARRTDVSLGDERTLRRGDAAGVDTVIDDIEVVDLKARYQIERTLGKGGMGEVFLATDKRLFRKVAIKQIPRQADRSNAAIARFLNEARAIALISHPNVVQVYELGQSKEGPFLVIEYVDGGSLLDRCKAGAIPLEEAVRIICKVCDGLARAHDVGIVHRDIKPANILLTKDGTPKLTDFGLAKAAFLDRQITMPGAVMGTPDFMPPEQRRDATHVDHRSDVWSLAATLYQAVTGRSPHVVRLHELPQELQPVIAKALEDEKEARYQSAKEFRDALETLVPSGTKLPTSMPVSRDTLTEGQCAACGTINSDLTRNFCRNPACASSLRTPCLQCDRQIPVWEPICGECGANQLKILANVRESLSSKCLSAEQHLQAYDFGTASEIAREIAGTKLPQMRDFLAWATPFLARVAEERDTARRMVARKIHEAHAHQAAFDYPAALQTLKTIPEVLRTPAVESLLKSCHQKHDEAARLVALIKQRIHQNEIKGLLPLVEQAIILLGDRQDLLTLRQQLIEQREGRLAGARTAMSEGNACKAAKALDEVVGDELSEADTAFLLHVRNAAALEISVVAVRNDATAAKRISRKRAQEILHVCEDCLRVHSNNAAALGLASRCRILLGEQSRHKHANAPSSVDAPGSPGDDRGTPIEYGVAITDRVVNVARLPAENWIPERSPMMLPNIPAAMAIDEAGTLHGGADVVSRLLRHDASVITGYLSLLGRVTPPEDAPPCHYGDATIEINRADEVALSARGHRFNPDQLAATVLSHVQKTLIDNTRDKHARCVVAVPATFRTAARHALRRAAVAAGVECVRLLTMTHAEAWACHFRQVLSSSSSSPKDYMGVVIHWDDSCCEVSVFDASRDGVIQIISTAGDATLGAARCKSALVDYLMRAEAPTAHERGMTSIERRWLWSLAETIHTDLNDASETQVALPCSMSSSGLAKAPSVCVTREQYNDMCRPVLQGIRGLINQSLQDARLCDQSARFDGHVFLTGSEARTLARHDIFGGSFVNQGVRSKVWHEDMASCGAALFGSVLDGRKSNMLLVANAPWSIGVETRGGVFEKLVERNTTIPTDKKRVFAAVGPEPNGVAIRVFEGENPMTCDNELIGAFCFDRITGSDAHALLEVAIDIDVDTNIYVSVKNLLDPTAVSHLLPYCEPLGDGLRELANSEDDELSVDSLGEYLGETAPESHESA